MRGYQVGPTSPRFATRFDEIVSAPTITPGVTKGLELGVPPIPDAGNTPIGQPVSPDSYKIPGGGTVIDQSELNGFEPNEASHLGAIGLGQAAHKPDVSQH